MSNEQSIQVQECTMELRACIYTIEFLANHCGKSDSNIELMNRALTRLEAIISMPMIGESGLDVAPCQTAKNIGMEWMARD
jgi:hypothetical protein